MWIRLKNIQIYAFHGVYEHEREHGGRFEIDVELSANLDRSARSDNLDDTIDYVRLQQTVADVSSAQRYRLLESFSNAIADRILKDFPAEEVIVRVRKPGVAAGAVLDSVEIECRKRR